MTRYLIALILLSGAAASAQTTFSYDFEQSGEFAQYEACRAPTRSGDRRARRGRRGPLPAPHLARTHALLHAEIAGRCRIVKNLVLSFDYRAEIEEGVTANYLGILFFYEDNSQCGRFDQPFIDEWRRAEVPIAALTSPNDGVLALGREFSRLNLYGRAPDDGALMTVWLDNIRLEVAAESTAISEQTVTSYANPPMFTGARRGRGRRSRCILRARRVRQGDTVTVSPMSFTRRLRR